jgi:hypothetical protein
VNPNLLKTFDTSLFKKYGTTHLDKFNLSLGGVFTIMVLFKLGTLQLLKRSKESKFSSLSNVSIDFFIGNFSLQIFNLKTMILIYTKGFSWE